MKTVHLTLNIEDDNAVKLLLESLSKLKLTDKLVVVSKPDQAQPDVAAPNWYDGDFAAHSNVY